MMDLLTICVPYSMFACIALVWSTLLAPERGFDREPKSSRMRSVAISDYLLWEWAAEHSHLFIFDIHLDRGIGEWDELASFWLPISLTDLPSMLKSLPPASLVVFCCRGAATLLDIRSKTALAQAGIGTIYFLDDSPVFQTNHGCDRELTTRDANRELRKITMRETRRAL